MIRKLSTLCLLLIGFQYGWSQDSCAILKNQRIDTRSLAQDFHQFYRLRACGFDSLDCELSAAFTGGLLFQRLQSGGSTDLYFGDVVQILEQFQSRPDYVAIREQAKAEKESSKSPIERPFYDSTLLCATPKYLDIFDSFGNAPQYFDYEQALVCSRVKNKQLFVYFTAYSSASSRRMEKVLADPVVRAFLLSHFVLVTLYVDGDFSGAKNNAALQLKLGNNSQPDLYIMGNTGQVQHSLGGYQSKDDFMLKLQEAVRP